MLHDLDWIAWPPWAPAVGSGSSFHLESFADLEHGRPPLPGLRSTSSAKVRAWLTAPARIAGVGHGHRDRPAPSAAADAPGAGVSQQAHPPSGRCTCASGVHLLSQGRTWRFLVHLRHTGVPLAAEVRPGSNYVPPRCTWHLQVHLRGEYGPQNARCTWR